MAEFHHPSPTDPFTADPRGARLEVHFLRGAVALHVIPFVKKDGLNVLTDEAQGIQVRRGQCNGCIHILQRISHLHPPLLFFNKALMEMCLVFRHSTSSVCFTLLLLSWLAALAFVPFDVVRVIGKPNF